MDSSQTAPVKKKGLKKLWAKVKSSVKSEPSRSQRNSAVAPSIPTTQTQEPMPAQHQETPVIAEQPQPVEESTMANKQDVSPAQSSSMPAEKTEIIEVDDEEQAEEISLPQTYTRSKSTSEKARFDRAQAVFNKYDLTLDASDWHSQANPNLQRVEKKPRMRVRYTCDSCNAMFGRERTCSKCGHERCAQCTRYPPKRTTEKLKKKLEKAQVAPSELVDMPTTGACHDCKTEFAIGQPDCANCGHKICETCLKETIMASPATTPLLPRNAALATS